jgi:hypothetical protein
VGSVAASNIESMGLSWVNGTQEPIPGHSVTDVTVMSWEEAALANPSRFAEDLRVLGLRNEDFQPSVDLAASVKSEAEFAVKLFLGRHGPNIIDPTSKSEIDRIYNSAQAAGLSKLRSWWKDRSIRIEERNEVTLQLPLFLISAAKPPGCTASFTIEGGQAQELGWSVTILGTGLGADSSIRTSTSVTFRATAGETKVIFMPATVSVEKVAVLDRGIPISHGYRIDVAGLRKQVYEPAVMLLAADAVPPLGIIERKYKLSGDSTGDIATYGYTFARSKKRSLRLSIKAYGTELGLSVLSVMDRSTELTYELRGGYNYTLHRVADCDGFIWR